MENVQVNTYQFKYCYTYCNRCCVGNCMLEVIRLHEMFINDREVLECV